MFVAFWIPSSRALFKNIKRWSWETSLYSYWTLQWTIFFFTGIWVAWFPKLIFLHRRYKYNRWCYRVSKAISLIQSYVTCIHNLKFWLNCSSPIGIASAEGSFSTLCQIKNYLRLTMGQKWLSNLALLPLSTKLLQI